ncbi:phage tail spike protein [Staphylococcus pseudintermedius]|uniref:phage tail spike protein n=2 Tax=Staphylococcus pseudintermedius TaxID=283734 RepID=UPI0028879023|nr:phage tail spike protein [Staphylococcus pseudintermedius]MDT0905459.1 phage tail spike protein [Staphylococcus pseudintermedius]
MIHVMNFKGEIVDFISQSDNAVFPAVHKRDINERMETFDFTILSERTTYMQERNRIIIQDKNKQYREFIIDRISEDIDGYTEVETVASYLEDITKARPYAPGKLEKMTTKQALSDVLKDTGWEVSDATEYGGLRTTSWTSYNTRYDVLLQLCTTYDMMADFYIEVGSNRVDKRLVVLRKRNPLFKGKEITYGKDLTGLKRTVDFSEIKTALLCVGPEPEEGKKRVELVVKDDESQAKYGLSNRYNWGIYEPETEDQNMTESRLRTLGTTELNKRKSEVITYEVTAVDIEKEYKHEVMNLGDMVRIKNRDFTPPLYVEAEVISEEYNLINKDVNYGFGTYKEFKESDLRSSFDRKLDAIRQKVSDGLSNVNTIVRESLEGELQYFERKILKGDTPPENPINDLLWLDTSNTKVPVLRRYFNGKWIKSSAENASDVGAITREQALYSGLSNTFINLTIQHSRLLKEVSEIVESEYFVDVELKKEVNDKLNATVDVFNHIKTNLDSMNEETATIGKLIDTQALFVDYREKMQSLYNAVENAKIAIDERFKLLQSQYTDEKYNEAMEKIAAALPNGNWDAETGQLTSNIPNEDRLNEIEIALQQNLTEQIDGAKQILNNQVDAKLLQLKDEITLSVRSVDEKIDGLGDGVNLLNDRLEPIKIRTTNAENNIKVLQDSLLLTATKTDVQRSLDEQLNPLKNEVNEQKAQLQIMSNSIDSKVSQSEYTSNLQGIVERLDNAETHRQQLSNQITDRVTLNDYNSGIDSTKQYADEQVNNLTLGNVNLIKSYHSPEYLKTATVEDDYSLLFSTSGKNINFFFYDSNGYTNAPLEANTDYILKLHEADENVEMGVFYNKGRNTIKTYTKDRVIRFNTADKVDFRILLIARDANVHAGKLSLYKGTKELDWTPNPEDVNAKIDQAKAGAEKSSKAYTDDKVQQVNQTLSTHETRLTQNGKDIALRATQEELNASKKTLSRVIADLTVNTTTGLTMTYDENGAIQSHTIGPDGIKLKGDRVNITVNKDFNVLVNDVANKADETNIINKINLSREGLDINVNNIGIRGGSSTSYVDIRNDLIELSGEYTRTFRGDTQKDYVYTRMKDGLLRFRNNTRNRSLYYSDFGISTYVDGGPNESSGTLQFFDYTYSKNARGVTLNSVTGVVALRSDNNRIILDASGTVNIESAESSVYIRPMRNSRIGNNEFRFWVKDNDNADDTDGVISFGSITTGYAAGSSIRLDKSTKTSFVYATNNNGDIGTGDFYARDLYGNLRAKTTNQYALVAYDGEFRVTDKNGATGSSINYRPIRVSEIKTTEGGAFSNHSGKNVYFGVGYNELRITANNFWNGGNPQYQDIRFKNWTAMSHEKYKYDIEEWDYNVLDVFKNELQLHCYKVNSEAATKYARIHHGIVLRDNSNLDKFPVEWRNGDGFDGNEIMFWNTKAIQELVFKVEEQNEKIKKLEEQLNEQTTS